MAYPFVPMPSFAEFRGRLHSEFNAEYKQLDFQITDPEGVDHDVFYFERTVRGVSYYAAIELPDETILTPSVLRSVCARLRIPLEKFGFTLG